MASGRTVVHALVGAVVSVVLSFVPFSTILGGAVAGFLEGPDGRDGLIAGALTGVITFVPIVGFALFALGIVGFGMGVAVVPIEGFAVVLVLIAMLSTVVLLYTVGLSLLGGYLGAYLARTYPEKRTRTRRTVGMERRSSPRHRRTGGRRSGSARRSRAPSSPAASNESRGTPRPTNSLESPRDEFDRDATSDPEPDRSTETPDERPRDRERSSETRWHENRDEAGDDGERRRDGERTGDRDEDRDRDRDRDPSGGRRRDRDTDRNGDREQEHRDSADRESG